jgi:hypothetical protein
MEKAADCKFVYKKKIVEHGIDGSVLHKQWELDGGVNNKKDQYDGAAEDQRPLFKAFMQDSSESNREIWVSRICTGWSEMG